MGLSLSNAKLEAAIARAIAKEDGPQPDVTVRWVAKVLQSGKLTKVVEMGDAFNFRNEVLKFKANFPKVRLFYFRIEEFRDGNK